MEEWLTAVNKKLTVNRIKIRKNDTVEVTLLLVIITSI